MKFVYAYKTSDGVRHEDAMESESRAAAFAALRERGIRPIKVCAADGSKANGETKFITRKRFVLVALVVGIFVGGAAALWYARTDWRDSRLIAYESRGAEIIARHEKMVGTLHLEALRDYHEILEQKNSWTLNQKISLSHFSFKEVRQNLKELCLEAFECFPAETHPSERAEVERIYQRLMDAVDVSESRIRNDELAFRLLDANRGKWSVKDGRIAWAEPSLAADFAAYTRELK